MERDTGDDGKLIRSRHLRYCSRLIRGSLRSRYKELQATIEIL